MKLKCPERSEPDRFGKLRAFFISPLIRMFAGIIFYECARLLRYRARGRGLQISNAQLRFIAQTAIAKKE